MSGVVHFGTERGEWAVEVEHVERVLSGPALTELPDPLPGVAGLLRLPGASVAPVLDAVGGEIAGHVLVLTAAGRRFGLLAGRVRGILRAEHVRLQAAPAGQDEELVTATIPIDDVNALLIDPAVLAARLERPR